MAVQFNVNQNSIPTFPTVRPALPTNYTPYKPYNPKQNTYDPEAYYTKALGFLPIDTRYLSNTTNSLAYNSMADVILNKGAIEKRWGDSWLSEWYGYVPRLFVDTGLLLKDTIVDPMVQGAIDDGWSGFARGGSTALMNTLVNLGNTLDIVANPIKGLVLDGGDGFVKGLIGDENGRKQYDYADYIDTGNGVSDFFLSLGAEFISDPLNWISLGGKAAVSGGAKALSDSATSTLKTTVNAALDSALKNVDDIAEYAAKNISWLTEDTAKAVISQMADSSGVVSRSLIDNAADTFSKGLKRGIQTVGKRGGSQVDTLAAAQKIAQSKSARMKAGLFDVGVKVTPAQQMAISEYLKAGSITPSLLDDTLYRLGSGAIKVSDAAQRGLLYTASAQGFGAFVLGNKVIHRVSDILKVRHAADSNTIIRNITDLDADIRIDPEVLKLKELDGIETGYSSLLPDTHRKIIDKLNDAKNTFNGKVLEAYENGNLTQATYARLRKETLDTINEAIVDLAESSGFKSLDDYIDYFKRALNYSKIDSNILEQALDQLNTFKRVFTEAVDNTRFKEIRNTMRVYKQAVDDVFTGTQDENIAKKGTEALNYTDKIKAIKLEQNALFDELNVATKNLTAQRQMVLENIEYINTQRQGLQDLTQSLEGVFATKTKSPLYYRKFATDYADLKTAQDAYDKAILDGLDDAALFEKQTQLIDAYNAVYQDLSTTVYTGLSNRAMRLMDGSDDLAKNISLRNYIDSLKSVDIPKVDEIVDLKDYINGALVSYTLMTNQTRFVNDLLGLDLLGKSTGTPTPMNLLLREYANPNSGLYAYLNDVHVKSGTVEAHNRAHIRSCLSRLDDYNKAVDRLVELCDKNFIDAPHRQGLIDALVKEVNSGRVMSDKSFAGIAERMLTGADLYYRNFLTTDSFAMDNVLQKVALEVYNKSAVGSTQRSAANRIINALKNAHDSNVDVDNWIDLMYIASASDNPVLKSMASRYKTLSKGKHTLIFDIESTGAKELSATPFQISGRILSPSGEVVETFNYYIKPAKGTRPLDSVLRKLAPDTVENTPKALHEWFDNLFEDTNKIVFNRTDEALRRIEEVCAKYDSLLLAGQNIKNFDIPMLSEYASQNFKHVLQNSEVFDSLDFMMSQNFFQLTGDMRKLFVYELQSLMHNIRNTSILFNGAHLFSAIDIDYLSRLPHAYSNIVKSLQDAWNTTPDFNPTKYFTVSKLNVDTLTDSMKAYMQNLYTQGLINTVDVHNIMNWLNSNVAMDQVRLNMKTAINYELANIFDIHKVGVNGITSRAVAETLTTQTQAILNIRNSLKPRYIKGLLDDSETLLQAMRNPELCIKYDIKLNDNYMAWALDDLDDATKVATALYMYNRLAGTDFLTPTLFKQNKQFQVLRNLEVDTETGLLKCVYEDGYYTYNEIAAQLNTPNPLDTVRAYNTQHNIYSVHTAAMHRLQADNAGFARKVMDYLAYKKSVDKLGKKTIRPRTKAERLYEEQLILRYNDYLDEAHIQDILTRPDRVNAFKTEVRMRAGRLYFESKTPVDLSDFAADDGLIVAQKELFDDMGKSVGYGNVILATRQVYEDASDFVQKINIIQHADLSDELYDLIREDRYRKGLYVQNIGWSHGDYLTKKHIKAFDDMLAAQYGIDVSVLPDVNLLTTKGFFGETLNANNSIIGGYQTFNRVFANTDLTYVNDPFKITFYNTRGAVTVQHSKLAAYLNLLFNDYNALDADLFKGISDSDLTKLFKQNKAEFGLYYLEKPHIKEGSFVSQFFSDQTKSGYVLREVPIINEKSLEVARRAGAHLLPRAQASQMMQTVNTFKLPPIAQFASNISAVYKVAYLGSIGLLMRNCIDSNYKTRIGLDIEVPLPQQIKHLFSTMQLIKKYDTIGQLYTDSLGKYFGTDLDYEVLYKVCNNLNEADIVAKITADYSGKTAINVERKINELLKIDPEVLREIQGSLIDPDMFSIMDAFIRYGPSAGMSKQVLENIGVATGSGTVTNKVITWITENSPMRFVYGTNDMIEQSARLSMYLQDLSRGSTVTDAINNVLRTHFDYSDKTLGMLYTEIIFPFMNFSYKNLDFWLTSVFKNPKLVGELENLFRPIMNYNSLWEPNQEVYENYDYTFDWSKDVWSFGTNVPWTQINAARLYHLLAGNIVIDTGKDVMHDAGYGEKMNDLYSVFKLSPSFLDATRMLFTPLDAYSERLLPPYETMVNLAGQLSGLAEDNTKKISIASLVNSLPYVDVITQRLGIDEKGWRHNNVIQRVKDAGPLMAIPSVFGAAYVPQKDNIVWYDSDFNVLGGFKPNYYARRNYSNPYYNYSNPYVSPRYTINRMAQKKRKPKDLYIPSIRERAYQAQYKNLIKGATNKIMKARTADYYYYY